MHLPACNLTGPIDGSCTARIRDQIRCRTPIFSPWISPASRGSSDKSSDEKGKRGGPSDVEKKRNRLARQACARGDAAPDPHILMNSLQEERQLLSSSATAVHASRQGRMVNPAEIEASRRELERDIENLNTSVTY